MHYSWFFFFFARCKVYCTLYTNVLGSFTSNIIIQVDFGLISKLLQEKNSSFEISLCLLTVHMTGKCYKCSFINIWNKWENWSLHFHMICNNVTYWSSFYTKLLHLIWLLFCSWCALWFKNWKLKIFCCLFFRQYQLVLIKH